MPYQSCPPEPVLLRLALRTDADPSAAGHVATCERCSTTLAELTRLTASVRQAASTLTDSPACLDELAVARVADGAGTPGELEHVADCAGCRVQVAELAAGLSSPAVASEVERLGRAGSGAWRRSILALGAVAAAVAITVAVARAPGSSRAAVSPVYRDAPSATAARPAVVTPVDGVTSLPVRLVWRTTGEATQYRVTVFAAEGSIMWEGLTKDTTVAVPDTVALAGGVAYWWRVEARVGFDRWIQSAVTPFTIDRPAAPAAADGR